jgi:hypothetical protein
LPFGRMSERGRTSIVRAKPKKDLLRRIVRPVAIAAGLIKRRRRHMGRVEDIPEPWDAVRSDLLELRAALAARDLLSPS